MKRSSFYLMILVLMLGAAQYVHMKFSARMATYQYNSNGKVLLEKEELIEHFEEYGSGTFGEEAFQIEFKDGDSFCMYDSTSGIVNSIILLEDNSKNENQINISQRKNIMGDCGDFKFKDLNMIGLLWIEKKDADVQSMSKELLFQSIREADNLRSFIHRPKEDDKSWEYKLMTSPIIGFLLLLGFFLTIWLLDVVSNLLGRFLNQPKWKILCVLIFIPFFVSFIKADIRTYQALIATGKEWSNLFIWRIGLDFMLVPFVLLFFYFKNNFFDKLDFADGEAAKFTLLFLAVITYTFLYGYLDFQILYYLDTDTKWTQIWLSVQMPAMALLVASGNFLNNFRKHFFQLKNKEVELEIAQVKELESSSELEALQSKVNPHFLYNSLNSIASLAQEDPVKTEAMAMALSKFYKYSTNRKDEHFATVASEIEMLEIYLEIEKIRFGERLQVSLNYDETTKDIKLPRFLLQPLVENAIKHGYNENTNEIKVQVFAEKKENQLHLKIMDSGKDFSDEMNSGYGLRSVQKKLKLFYPNQHELIFNNQPEKSVFITIDL